MEQQDKTLYTVTVFTENRVGLLNQISILFTRRKLNIESLSVSPSSIKGIHKFTITTYSDVDTLVKLTKQIEKRIDILKAFFYTDDEIVYQEIALFKVPTDNILGEHSIESLVRKHSARILEITKEYIVIEKTGHSDETKTLFDELKPYGITQFVRSGRVAVTKSTQELVTQFIEEQEERQNQEINL